MGTKDTVWKQCPATLTWDHNCAIKKKYSVVTHYSSILTSDDISVTMIHVKRAPFEY
jgi:hypothetical protein